MLANDCYHHGEHSRGSAMNRPRCICLKAGERAHARVLRARDYACGDAAGPYQL